MKNFDELDITLELYDSLKSMTESYDLLRSHLPALSMAQGVVDGFFIGAVMPAKDAILKFEILKARNETPSVSGSGRYSYHAGDERVVEHGDDQRSEGEGDHQSLST